MTNKENTDIQTKEIDYAAEAKQAGVDFIKDCVADAEPKIKKLASELAGLLYMRFTNWLNELLSA